VKDDGKIVGMISMTDIMRAMVNGADEDVEIYI
jgi:CBS domain-containing protein